MTDRLVQIEIDGKNVEVSEGATILDACRKQGIGTPTLCYLENLTPVNACRVCVVELEGARTLVPACSRTAEPGMKVQTDSERVRHSRKLVLELLASSVDMTLVNDEIRGFMQRYDADPSRFGEPAPPAQDDDRDRRHAGHHHTPDGAMAETVAQPVDRP